MVNGLAGRRWRAGQPLDPAVLSQTRTVGARLVDKLGGGYPVLAVVLRLLLDILVIPPPGLFLGWDREIAEGQSVSHLENLETGHFRRGPTRSLPIAKVWSSPPVARTPDKHSRKSLQACCRSGGIRWSPRWSPGGNIAGTSALFALSTPHDGVASRVVSGWRAC